MGISRGVSAGLLTSIQDVFRPVVLVDLDWPTGPVRVNSGSTTIVSMGLTFLPVGSFGSITIPDESISIGSPTTTLSLAGSLDELLDTLDQDPRNSGVSIYFGTVTSAGALTGAPVSLFSGYVDGVDFEFNRDGDIASSSISLSVASGPSPRAYATITHSAEGQKKAYPLDTAGRQVISANKKALDPDAWPEP